MLIVPAMSATDPIWRSMLQYCNPSAMKLLDGLAHGDKRGAERARRLKAGTVLVREYQGERHTVTVVADGFLWGDSTYKSLTTIARAITGTAWSGPRFFGVQPNLGLRDPDEEPVTTRPRLIRGGPGILSSHDPEKVQQ